MRYKLKKAQMKRVFNSYEAMAKYENLVGNNPQIQLFIVDGYLPIANFILH